MSNDTSVTTHDGRYVVEGERRGVRSRVGPALDTRSGARVWMRRADAGWCESVHRDFGANLALKHGVPGALDLVHDTAAGQCYMTMPLLEGRDLDGAIANGDITEGDIPVHGAALAATFDRAHTLRLVHGDIKPSNVFLESAPGGPKAKALDWESAHIEGSGLADGLKLFTVFYAAPEILLGGAQTREADVFSLGVTLFEMAVRLTPAEVRGASSETALHELARWEPPPLRSVARSIDSDLAAVIDRCLHRDPSVRPTMRELARELRRLSGPLTSDVREICRAPTLQRRHA